MLADTRVSLENTEYLSTYVLHILLSQPLPTTLADLVNKHGSCGAHQCPSYLSWKAALKNSDEMVCVEWRVHT
jgi:hypothetical protein